MRRIAMISCLAGLLLLGSSGTAGAATFTPTSADFGSQPVGTTSAPKTFTLGLGTEPAFAPGITISGPFKQTNNCPALLVAAVQPTCTVNVTFAPTAQGPAAGTLTSTSVLAGAPTAALSGTGAQPGTTNAARGKQCKKKGGKKKGGKPGKKGADAVAAKKKKGKCKKKKKGGKKK